MVDNATTVRRGEPDPRKFMDSPRGRYIVAQALHYAIQFIGQQPPEDREDSNRDDMLFILNGCFSAEAKMVRNYRAE